MTRGHRHEHIIVRAAAEGVPVAAIARITLLTSAEVRAALIAAAVQLPPAEWPAGERVPAAPAAKIPMDAVTLLAPDLCMTFDLTPAEGAFLALLLATGNASRTSLRVVISGEAADTKNKIVDVIACRVRKKIAGCGAQVVTIWGRGYAMTAGDIAAVHARTREAVRRAPDTGEALHAGA